MRKPRSMWVRKWLSEYKRQQLGHYSTFLIRELRSEDVRCVFFSFLCLRFGFSHFGDRVCSSSTFLFWRRWIRCSCCSTAGSGAGRKPFVRLDFCSGIASRPWSVDRLTTRTRIKLSLPGSAFILRPRPCTPFQTVIERSAPYHAGPQTVTDRDAPWLNATKRLTSTLACHVNRYKTWQTRQNAQQPWSNCNKRTLNVKKWQNVKGPWDAVEYICFAFHYGQPPSFATVWYVRSRFVALTPFYHGLLRFACPP